MNHSTLTFTEPECLFFFFNFVKENLKRKEKNTIQQYLEIFIFIVQIGFFLQFKFKYLRNHFKHESLQMIIYKERATKYKVKKDFV